jgi:hypothetical protein
MTEGALIDSKALRTMVCSALYDTLAIVDVTAEVVASRVVTVATALNDHVEVTDEAFLLCTRALTETVSGFAVLAADDDNIPLVMDAFSAVLSRGYPLPDNVLDEVSAALSDLSVGRQQVMAVGEDATSIATAFARLYVGKHEARSLDGSSSLEYPLLGIERLIAHTPVDVVFDYALADPSDILVVSAIALNHSVAGPEYNTNASRVLMELDFPDVPLNASSLTASWRLSNVHLENSYYKRFFSPAKVYPAATYWGLKECSRLGETIRIDCPEGEVYYTCGELNLGRLNYTCPSTYRVPICLTADVSVPHAQPDSRCHVTSFSENSTVCQCDLVDVDPWSRVGPVGNSTNSTTASDDGGEVGARRLAAFGHVSSDGGTRLMGGRGVSKEFVVTSSAFTLDMPFTYTFFPRDIPPVIQDAVVLLTWTVVVVVAVLGAVLFIYMDHEDAAYTRTQEVHVHKERELRPFFESLLPLELSNLGWHERFWRQLGHQHALLCLMHVDLHDDHPSAGTYEKRHAPIKAALGRNHPLLATRWTTLVLRVLTLMAAVTYLHVMYFADDGYCQARGREGPSKEKQVARC